MIIQVLVPHVGESITEGVIASWAAEDGALIEQDDELFELETDKVTMMVQAEHAGKLKILVPADTTVQMGAVVGEIDTDAVASDSQPEPETPRISVPQTGGPALNPVAGMAQAKTKLTHEKLDSLAPAVRALLKEHALDPDKIKGTGRDGRITKADVLATLSLVQKPVTPVQIPETDRAPAGTDKQPAAGASTAVKSPLPQKPSQPQGERRETRTKMSRLRQRIAERLVSVKNETAMLTTFNEADMTQVIALRKRYKESFKDRHGVPLGFMPFFVKAVVDALIAVPELNAQIDGDEIVQHHYYDIGIAVGTERGLVVPVLRGCDKLSFSEIEQEIRRLADRVRTKSITLDELTGGVFSITNGGIYGNLLSTPILNPPQSAILGMHAIKKRAVVTDDDQIVARPMMYLAVSYDHRLVDGREAVTFLKRVVQCLENPERLMLQV